MAGELGRLADVGERLLERLEQHDRRHRDEELQAKWAPPIQPVGIGLFLNAIPGLAAQFQGKVPPEFALRTGEGEYTIACPCGQNPVIRPRKLTSCQCGRYFLHDGLDIRVACTPPTETT